METQKNTNVALEKKLTSYSKKPDEGTRFIVLKNLKTLVPKIIKDINEFTHTNEIKYKALKQLQHVIIIAEKNIQPYLEQIIKVTGKYISYDDDLRIPKACVVVSELCGIYIDSEIYVPLLMTLFGDEEAKNNLSYLRNLIYILSVMIQNETAHTIEPLLEKIIQLLSNFEQLYEDNESILIALFEVDKQIISLSGENASIYCRQLFTILLNVQATTTYGKANFELVEQSMLKLAKICGYDSVSDLHSNEVSILLEEFTADKSYENWNKFSRDRFKFDVIVRNCKEGIAKFMPTIIQIIQHNSNRDAELEIKIDMLVLIEYLFGQEKLNNIIKEYSVQLLQKVLIPSIVWKIGKTQTRTRKAGIINIIKMIDADLIEPEGLMTCIKELLPPIKNCLEDDYTPDLRFAACNAIERVFKCSRELIDYENIFQFYTCLLERLDDAQDAIRMEITKTMNVFFSFPCLQQSATIAEYCIKAIFIHLDDQSEDIQNSMFNCLKFAARFFTKQVMEEAKSCQSKMKYPRRCTELINYCSELLSEQ